MSINQITPDEAKEILDQDPKAVYLDVRSVAEFTQGHAQGAINIPILHKNPQGMIPNPDFIRVAQAVLAPDQTLVVGCQMGGRSQKACEILEGLGFQKLHNIQGGYGGSPAQMGWRDLDLPISQENGEGVSFESLLAKTK